MNVEELRDLVETRAEVVPHSRAQLAGFERVLTNANIADYLLNCLPNTSYVASDVNILDLGEKRAYAAEGCSPGGVVLPFGYVAVALDVGGNAISFGSDGHGYWADHTVSTSSITYHNLERDEWEDWGNTTPEKVRRALVSLSASIENFLKDLLADRLSEQLEALS